MVKLMDIFRAGDSLNIFDDTVSYTFRIHIEIKDFCHGKYKSAVAWISPKLLILKSNPQGTDIKSWDHWKWSSHRGVVLMTTLACLF